MQKEKFIQSHIKSYGGFAHHTVSSASTHTDIVTQTIRLAASKSYTNNLLSHTRYSNSAPYIGLIGNPILSYPAPRGAAPPKWLCSLGSPPRSKGTLCIPFLWVSRAGPTIGAICTGYLSGIKRAHVIPRYPMQDSGSSGSSYAIPTSDVLQIRSTPICTT